MDINITIPQEEIEAVLTQHVQQKMPTVSIKGVKLGVTRNPQGVTATVDADFGGISSSTKKDDTAPNSVNPQEDTNENTEASDEPVEETETESEDKEDTPASKKSTLFNSKK